MTKFKTPALLCSLLFILSSCFSVKYRGPVTSYNGPAFFNNDVSYQPKPISADSLHHGTYVSATIISGGGANSKDDMSAGQLNLGMAYTVKHFNFAYGAFGAFGDYHNETVPDTQTHFFINKSIGFVGSRASINYYITSGRVDIRLIGIEAAYSHEFGDYAAFRREVYGQPYFFTNTRTDLFTWGGSSEVDWYGRDPSFQYGFRVFAGRTNSNLGKYSYAYSEQPQKISGAFAYFMQIKNAFMVAEFTGSGGHFTLGYRFQ
ncbi:MAG: hypothetical protein ACHQHN_13145 [Sphingobacteriales bacterium]